MKRVDSIVAAGFGVLTIVSEAEAASCDGCQCDIRQSSQGGTMTRWTSPLAEKMQGFLESDNQTNGILVRNPDWNESTWMLSSHVHMSMRPPNPMYTVPPGATDFSIYAPQSDTACPGRVEEIPEHYQWNKKTDADDSTYDVAQVGFVFGTRYELNQDHDNYSNEGVQARISVCYPTEADSLEDWGRNYKRDPPTNYPQQGSDGKGCHRSQDFGCDADGSKCLAIEENGCECNFQDTEGAGFGEWTVKHSLTQDYMKWVGAAPCVKFKQIKQPSFQMNYMSCWTDPKTDGNMEQLIAAQNSWYSSRHEWLNDQAPSIDIDKSYHGWTECSTNFDGKNSKEAVTSSADAVLIVLPTQDASDSHQPSLCDLDTFAQKTLEDSLKALAEFGDMPHLIMQQTKGMSKSDCDKFWGGKDCSEGFRKEFFVQNFIFPGGSCLLTSEEENGEPKYFKSDSKECKDYLNGVDWSQKTDKPYPPTENNGGVFSSPTGSTLFGVVLLVVHLLW